MSDYTPGPYKVVGSHITTATNYIVATVDGPNRQDAIPEREANKRLLAAAPELLEALRECLAMLNVAIEQSEGDTFGICHNRAMDAMSSAESAIAKATKGNP